MTAPDSGTLEGRPPPKGGRRRFLSRVGASGLAAAAAVFGRSSPAEAVAAGCCSLCLPKSGTRAQCASGRYYMWICSYGTSGFLYCNCCEHGNSSGGCAGVTQSWYSCQYG